MRAKSIRLQERSALKRGPLAEGCALGAVLAAVIFATEPVQAQSIICCSRTSRWAAVGPDRAASPIASNTLTRPRLTSSAACASSALLYRASTPIVAASFRRGILPPRTRRAAARTRRPAPTGMASSRDSMGRRRAAPSPPAAQPPMQRRLVYLMPWPSDGKRMTSFTVWLDHAACPLPLGPDNRLADSSPQGTWFAARSLISTAACTSRRTRSNGRAE